MKRQFPRNAIVAASGLVKQNKYGITLENPEFEVLNSQGGNINSLKIGRLLPVYPLTDGIPADVIRNGVMEAMVALPQISDPLPVILKQQYGLMELQEAIARIHYPEDQDQLSHARRRLIFDEFFYLQLGFLQRRQEQKESRIAVSFTPNGRLIEEFNQILPFSLTNAQKGS